MISRKILIASLCATLINTNTQASSPDLKDLVVETARAFHSIIIELESTRTAEEDGITKRIVHNQKKAIKAIVNRLKEEYQSEKDDSTACKEKRKLYREFKVEVYRFWKKTGNLPELQ